MTFESTNRFVRAFVLTVGSCVHMAASLHGAEVPSVGQPTEMLTQVKEENWTGFPRQFQPTNAPWGKISRVQIDLQWPEEGRVTDPEFWMQRPWVFPMQAAAVSNVFRSAGLTADQLAAATDPARWTLAERMVVVEPDEGLLSGLSPYSRSRIYRILALSDLNPYQRCPFSSPSNLVSGWLEESGLPEATVTKLTGLCYPRGTAICFSDPQVFAELDAGSKSRLIRSLSRTPSQVLNLRVDSTADIDGMARYWGTGGRERKVRPLLDAAARVHGGSTIPVTQLLPAFPRNLLYTYPEPGRSTKEPPPDCFWSALNFFNGLEPEHVSDLQSVMAALKRDFSPVSQPLKFGDIILLKDPDGTPMHAAVFIADGIVFTKNGATDLQPWTLQDIDEMVFTYLITSDPAKGLGIQVLRRKKT